MLLSLQKRTRLKSSSEKEPKKKGGIRKYFRELKSEMKKVVWPTRKQVVNNTGVVLGVMAFMGLSCLRLISVLAMLSRRY